MIIHAIVAIRIENGFLVFFCTRYVIELDLISDHMWTAPEFLVKNAPTEKTKAADVYSYGIILKEICVRNDPYEDSCLTPNGKYETYSMERLCG